MDNARGAAFMVLAMLCFAIEDAIIKALSASLPVGQILSLTCFGGLIVFMSYMKLTGQKIWHPAYLNERVVMRSGCEVIGSCLFVTALALIPLTTASAVIQATPLVVALGAAIFLGQPIGWRRWLAILAGFAGVLIIIRPGFEGFTVATLFAVGGMLGLAARDLITRSVNVDMSGMQFGIHAFAFVTPAALLLLPLQGQSLTLPRGFDWVLLAGSVGMGCVAYLTIVAATRIGNAGIISSFRYSRMVFALIIGYAVFREKPDAPVLIGATVIIASGIYTLWRETRLYRASLKETPAL